MPIMRSYMCAACGHHMDVMLTMDQVDEPPPDCPRCTAATQQDFKPPGIIGHTARSKAEGLKEQILDQDFNVASYSENRGTAPTVRYKDQNAPVKNATWGMAKEALEQAISIGRQTRIRHGSGLDVLQRSLQSGAQTDLIEASKKRAIKVW